MDNRTLGLLLSERAALADWETIPAAGWEALADRAQAEGVGPLLYWKLSGLEKDPGVPVEARESLRLAYAATRIQNQIIFKNLRALAASLHQEGIPAVVLKGACFALTIYPDPGLRPMGDVDVLVPKARLARAVEIAKSLGYGPARPEASPGLDDLFSHHVGLHNPGPQGGSLEIHDRLAGEEAFSFSVPVDWFWEHIQPLELLSPQAGLETLLMLSPEAQVLFAAGHAMLQHGGDKAPLRWFYDLDLLIRHYQNRLDWDLLLSQARIFEWGSALEAALAQTIVYFATPIPDSVQAALKGISDRHRDLVALKQARPATHILLEWQRLRSLNLYGRLRLVLALAFPSPAYMRWRYRLPSSRLLPVYYLFRWWGIGVDAVRTLAVLIRKGRAHHG